jgi:hypothetical protein
LLVKAELDSGDIRFWTGYGPLTWDSQVWSGAGRIMEISDIEETGEVKAVGTTFIFNSLNADLISVARSEDYQERPIKAWIALLDATGAVIDHPYMVRNARMDVMTLITDGARLRIEVKAESRLVDLERPSVFYYTDADQQVLFAGDLGFEFVEQLNNGREFTFN